MDAHHHREHQREKSVDNKLHGPSHNHHQEHQKSPPPPPPPPPSQSPSPSSSSSKQQQVTISPASPPSASSSPSHEFSFTISLHSSNPTTTTTTTNDNKKSNRNDHKSKAPPPSFAIDLSPADEIFFHGHLLPLHLLSHLPVSPRSSTNSLESFTLPTSNLSSSDDTRRPIEESHNKNSTTSSTTTTTSTSQKTEPATKGSSRNRSIKSTSFSLFGLGKWRREYEFREREDKEKPKRKLRFEVSHVLKRYMRMVRPLLFFGGRRRESSFQLRRQPYSFSGILSSRNNSSKDLRERRRGEYSAPASMRTSPSNSGLLVATAALPSSASDSTMEELQAAIQAAIAHCKNSIAAEDHNLKCK